jgi:hypothetical protein
VDIREEIKRETNPEILRQMAGWILEDNDRLRALNAEIQAQKAREAQLQADFRDKLTVLRKVIFGTSSERRQKDVADRPRATDWRRPERDGNLKESLPRWGLPQPTI